MGEQALSIVKQAVDLALAAGVYKSTQDVVLIHNALTNLKELVDSDKKAREYHNLLKEDKYSAEVGPSPIGDTLVMGETKPSSKKTK